MSNNCQEQEHQESCLNSRLFEEFPPSTYEEWRDVAEKSLKGGTFEKKLITKTYEDIDLQPMYWEHNTADLPHMNSLPGFAPYVRGTAAPGYLGRPWQVSQELDYGSPAAMNRTILSDLERGQTALNILVDRATRAGLNPDEAPAGDVGRGGVSVSSAGDMSVIFSDIDLGKVPVYIQAGLMALPVTALLAASMLQRCKSPAFLQGCIGLDPLETLVSRGSLPGSLENYYDEMYALTAWAIKHAPQLQTIVVQGHPYHNAGGNAVQELAFAVATGVEYLGEMQTRGLAVDDVAPRMRFSLSAGSEFFMEIAKFRAARLIWAQVIKAFGGNEESQRIFMHVCTSDWNKTIYDPYVNILRTTTEAFAGVMGGADSLHVATFDQVIRPADDFSRRIARNIQIILDEECKFTIPVDPAGGSFYIETITDAIAQRVWRLLQEVEAMGGMSKALQEGFPQAQTGQIAAKRRANIARRKDIFVGTNMYPNLIEKPLEPRQVDHAALQQERGAHLAVHRSTVDGNLLRQSLSALATARINPGEDFMETAVAAAAAGATLGDLAGTLGAARGISPVVGAIQIHRGPELFEALRSASDAYKQKTGAAPTVFLANMGPIPQHKARADFATGFFEAGGFAVLKNNGFPTVEKAAQAAIDSGAQVAVICSTDATYPELVPPLTKMLKEAGTGITVILAGYPTEHLEAFKEAGVDDFIHMRANCHQLLLDIMTQKGVI